MTHRRSKPKFIRLRRAPYFKAVDAKVREGCTGTMIARWLHESGQADDISEARLAAEINAYRRTLTAMEIVEHIKPAFVEDAEKQIESAIDEVQEFADLYKVQWDRVLEMAAAEKKNNVHNRTLSNEIRVAAEILRSSHQVKLAIGIVRDPPQEIDGTGVTEEYGDQVGRVMMSAKSRQKVIDALRQVRSLSSGDVLDFKKKTG